MLVDAALTVSGFGKPCSPSLYNNTAFCFSYCTRLSSLLKPPRRAPLDADTAANWTQIRHPRRIAVLRDTRAETDERLLQPWPPPSATACGALIKDATVAVPRARAKTIVVKIITRFAGVEMRDIAPSFVGVEQRMH
jgi:hypothetical protein